MKAETIIIIFLSLYAIIFSALQWRSSKIRKGELQKIKDDARSFEAMTMLFRYLLTGNGSMDSHFERIQPKKFVYAVRDILSDRFLEAFEKLEVHNDLTYIYKQGPNWDILKQRIIEKMKPNLAKELYLHYFALETNNSFKVGDHSPEDRIRIAKEIGLAVIMKAASKEKGEPALQETAEKIIKEFDLGDERKTLLMAEVIKIEKGIPVLKTEIQI